MTRHGQRGRKCGSFHRGAHAGPGLLSLSTHHRAGTSGRFRAGIARPMRPDRTALSTGYAALGGLMSRGFA